MATNPFFQDGFSDSFLEHDLVDSVTRESIQIVGQNVAYILREKVKHDKILNEVQIDEFNRAIIIEMSFSTDGFTGDQAQLSKFGFENRDELTFYVAKSRFIEEVKLPIPREGDLIYHPMTDHLFEIKFVEEEVPFYPLGNLYMFTLNCQLFRYNYQKFKTDIPRVDKLSKRFTEGVDPFANNDDIHQESRRILDFNESNPFGEF